MHFLLKYSPSLLSDPDDLECKATGNSRSESQKFPPVSVKIPENSRYENTAYTSIV